MSGLHQLDCIWTILKIYTGSHHCSVNLISWWFTNQKVEDGLQNTGYLFSNIRSSWVSMAHNHHNLYNHFKILIKAIIRIIRFFLTTICNFIFILKKKLGGYFVIWRIDPFFFPLHIKNPNDNVDQWFKTSLYI